MRPHAIALLLCLAFTPAHALQIKAQPFKGNDYPASVLLSVEGDFQSGEAEKLQAILEAAPLPRGTLVALHSRGGDLMDGMKMGALFREKGFNTVVAQVSSQGELKKGACLSACVYAFTGGQYRYYPFKDGVLGVHQFREGDKSNKVGVAETQEMASSLVMFLHRMDISPRLFWLSVQAPPQEFRALSREEMEEMEVINEGVQKPLVRMGWERNIPVLDIGLDTDRGARSLRLRCHHGKSSFEVQAYLPTKTMEMLSHQSPSISLQAGQTVLFSKPWHSSGIVFLPFGFHLKGSARGVAEAFNHSPTLSLVFNTGEDQGGFKWNLRDQQPLVQSYLSGCSAPLSNR